MTRWYASVGLALACTTGGIGFGGSAMAQETVVHEIRRTELGRAPVSGDDTREIIMQLVEFPPGATSPRHVHHGEESFYVIEGGTVKVSGKEPKQRPAGERGINPRGVPHAGYTVVGDRTIKVLSVYVVDKGKPLQEPSP